MRGTNAEGTILTPLSIGGAAVGKKSELPVLPAGRTLVPNVVWPLLLPEPEEEESESESEDGEEVGGVCCPFVLAF
jgi:hypothetical protein